MGLIFLKSCKSKRKFKKTRHVKKYNLRGQRIVRYHDRIPSKSRERLTIVQPII